MGVKILLVSDDNAFATQTRDWFRSKNFTVDLLGYSDSVLAEVNLKRPSLLIIDFKIDAMAPGLELLRFVKNRPVLKKTPVIVILEKSSREAILAVKRYDTKDILLKSAGNEAIGNRMLRYIKSLPPVRVSSTVVRQEEGAESSDKGGLEWSDPATTAFKKQVQREVNKRLEMLPSLPHVVMEVMELVDSDNSSAGDFEKHISNDQALAARILRVANSSFFAQSRTIKSIRDAIVVLGFRTLKSVVMAATTNKILNRSAEGYGYSDGGLWKHSIGCAAGCKIMATMLMKSEHETEELFVHGLLHDVGKLLLANFVAEKKEEFMEAFEQRQLSVVEAENLIVGIDHCKVGEMIAEQWRLPKDVRNAIKYHEEPGRTSQFDPNAAFVHGVNYLCRRLKIGMQADYVVSNKLDIEAMKKIDLDQDFFDGIEEAFCEQLEELESLFKMIGQD